MEVELKTNRSFSTILETLSALSIDHVVLQFLNDRLFISSMDPNHISLVNVSLDQTYFTRFITDKPYRIGIQIPILLKIFKSIHKDETVSLSYNESYEYLNVHIFSSITNRDQYFRINEIDIDVEEIEPNVDDYVWLGFLSGKNFKNLLKHSTIIEAADCLFQVSADNMILNIKGDLGTSQITYKNTENINISSINDSDVLTDPFTQTFSLTVLQHFTKLCTSDKQIFQFIMHPQKPICIKTFYNIEKNNKSFIECYLSPKFVDD